MPSGAGAVPPETGVYTGRLATIRTRGNFDLKVPDRNIPNNKIGAGHKDFKLLQRTDGYAYVRG